MKIRTIIIGIASLLTYTLSPAAHAVTKPLSQQLSGRILLQTESYGRAWYVNPVNGARYYLKDGPAAYEIMRTLGLGISAANLSKIPTKPTTRVNTSLTSHVSGRILLDVENNGEAWYVNPVDGVRYYLKNGEAAYALMKSQGLGITNANLAKIPMNETQLVPDTAFGDIAYALIRNNKVIAGKYKDKLLAPASVTKLMTALVLLDQKPDWNRRISITQEHLDYPTLYVGEDKTSEINLLAGDIVNEYDLWVAMLVASSNQATIALVDASGLTRSEFVNAMNAKVELMGLAKTKFFDPTGLDAHNVTTPRELALIAQEAFSRNEIADGTRKNGYMITPQQYPSRTITVADRNYSLNSYKPDAAKTGYLVEAGSCVALKKGNDIIVIMHAHSTKERNRVLNSLMSI